MKFFIPVAVVAAYSILPKQHVINEETRLIEVYPGVKQSMNDAEILQLIRDNVHFVDVTAFDEGSAESFVEADPLPSGVSKQSQVNPLIKEIDVERMTTFLTKFSSFYTRYYKSKTGVESAEWLESLVDESCKKFTNCSHYRFKHSRFPQFSVVARIEGTDSSLAPIIVGSHQDSVNGRNPLKGRSPGADDDGSGSTSVLETFRVLSESQFQPRRSVEFHFYAAEEAGLLGSMDVAAHYKKHGQQVHAMIQNDMTGYVNPRRTNAPTFGLIQDFVSPELTAYLSTLIEEYTSMKLTKTRCGYGCSDHASWYKNGYRSAFAIEGPFGTAAMSPFIHTDGDSVDRVDFEHIKEFVKLDLAFVVELSA